MGKKKKKREEQRAWLWIDYILAETRREREKRISINGTYIELPITIVYVLCSTVVMRIIRKKKVTHCL
jgi:hypothetical protein